MLDDAAVLLRGPGEEPWHVDERDDRDVERVAEPHEPRGLDGRVDVETPGEVHRLIRDDARRAAVEPREADDDVLRVVLVDLDELRVVDDRGDDLLDVVRPVRLGRDHRVERDLRAIRWILRGPHRRVLGVVARHEREQLA